MERENEVKMRRNTVNEEKWRRRRGEGEVGRGGGGRERESLKEK